MEEILGIEYRYNSLLKNILFVIDVKSNKAIIKMGNIEDIKELDKNAMQDIIQNIADISIYWKDNNIKNNNIIDGFNIQLTIFTKEKNITKKFKNIMPQNINEFDKIIDGVMK